MNPELHLYIIWENIRNQEKEIFEKIKENFEIKTVYEISWSKKNFTKNLIRFYGATLPNPEEKTRLCGTGKFLLILFNDNNPKHGKRGTSTGTQIVNTNVYDRKMKFRKMLGGGFPIHGSIHEKETNHNLTLLLGKNLQEIKESLPKKWDLTFIQFEHDLVGVDGWKNLNELFYVLNSTINYVVLRNFENFPDLPNEIHKDIDLLTDDIWTIPYITNLQKPTHEKETFRPYVKIENEKISFDFRYVGDKYYDEKWSKEILNSRKFSPKGFFVPNDENYFYSLLYHMLIHKKKISEEYLKKLVTISQKSTIQNLDFSDNIDTLKRILDNFMRRMNYSYANSTIYKIKHNEFSRMYKVAKLTAKNEGMKTLFRSVKNKMKRSIT